jgi:hypothetical protein
MKFYVYIFVLTGGNLKGLNSYILYNISLYTTFLVAE